MHVTPALTPSGGPVHSSGDAGAVRLFPARDAFPWPHVVVSLALLMGVGASFGLLGCELLLAPASMPSFFVHNQLVTGSRNAVLVALLLGALAPLPVAGLWLARRGRAGVAPLRQVADLGSPLGLLFAVPALFLHSTWSSNALLWYALLTLFVLTFEGAMRRALGALPRPLVDWARLLPRPRARTARALAVALVVAGAAGYAAFMSYYTLMNHRRMQTAAFDMGIYVNWMYNALHGHPFRTTVLFGPSGGNMIAGHAIYAALFLWLPVFAIKPGAEALLIYQSVMMGLAAIPLYAFAATQLPRRFAVAVALSYLLYAPLHGPNFYDFHELPIAIFFHFTLYYAIATRRTWLSVLMIAVLFCIREDIAVGTAVLGLFLLVTGLRVRFGAVLFAVSCAWFVVDKFVIMPMVGKWWFENLYKDLIAEGESGYGSVVKTILINPLYFISTLVKEGKLVYFLHLFTPLAFLPARRWALLLLACPGFFFTLMTTGSAPQLSIGFQYTTHWIPYLFGASVLALRVLGDGDNGRVRRAAAAAALCVGVFCDSYNFGAFFRHGSFVGGFTTIQFYMTPAEKKRYEDLRAILPKIPQNASVAATDRTVSHAGARLDMFTLRDTNGDAEYLLVDRDQMGFGNTRSLMKDAFAQHPYGLVAQSGDDFFLFKKNFDSPNTEAAKRTLGIQGGR